MRDVIAYIVVLAIIVAVAYDGKVCSIVAQLNLKHDAMCTQVVCLFRFSWWNIPVIFIFLQVTLSEAICFPMLYILYVAIVVFFTFLSVSSPPIDHKTTHDYVFFPQKWIAKRREDKINQNNVFFGKDEDEVIIKRSNEGSLGKSDSEIGKNFCCYL